MFSMGSSLNGYVNMILQERNRQFLDSLMCQVTHFSVHSFFAYVVNKSLYILLIKDAYSIFRGILRETNVYCCVSGIYEDSFKYQFYRSYTINTDEANQFTRVTPLIKPL